MNLSAAVDTAAPTAADAQCVHSLSYAGSAIYAYNFSQNIIVKLNQNCLSTSENNPKFLKFLQSVSRKN